ncbi:MAG: hypothetical protein ACO2PO_04840 [Candidatus Calescibacterium sp.]
MENKNTWEQIEKQKERQIQRLHYSKERQVIKTSLFNQAQEWARLQAQYGLSDEEILMLIRKWIKKLYTEWRMWEAEFDSLYFQNLRSQLSKKINNEQQSKQ